MTLNNFFDNEEWAASICWSTNEDIGVLPPGLISNEEDLFEDDGQQLRRDLRVNLNYRAVNPFVWYLFFVNYGGLPGAASVRQSPREAIDIYSKSLMESMHLSPILPEAKLANL